LEKTGVFKRFSVIRLAISINKAVSLFFGKHFQRTKNLHQSENIL